MWSETKKQHINSFGLKEAKPLLYVVVSKRACKALRDSWRLALRDAATMARRHHRWPVRDRARALFSDSFSCASIVALSPWMPL